MKNTSSVASAKFIARESLENRVLNGMRGQEVRVFLVNTKALMGTLRDHDETVILLSRPGHSDTLVFKDHVSTVVLAVDATA